VRFAPPRGVAADVEVVDFATLRRRAGHDELSGPQRLDFDLLLRVDAGSTVHQVDFVAHPLAPGDVLWVRAGQVHRWGETGDLGGTVVLFSPAAVDDQTRELVKAAGTCTRSHWSQASADGSVLAAAFAHLAECARDRTGGVPGLREALTTRALAILLLHLAEASPPSDHPTRTPSHEHFVWFREQVDRDFRELHKVQEYADRLGYSTRTLNRVARDNSGLSAKQLIDERIVLEAKRLLTHGDATVAEIAEHLGFPDPSNFSAFFRARAGLTPGAFRVGARPEVER